MILVPLSILSSFPISPAPVQELQIGGTRRRRSKKGREIEYPEKSKKQREHHRNECMQSVRTDQKSRNGCLRHAVPRQRVRTIMP
jgi:hypothetical protein